MVRGELPEFTCLLGTLVQEVFMNHPALQRACGAGIEAHAQTLETTVEAARAKYAPQAEWNAADLARYTQTVLQGGFVLAKAMNDPALVLDAIEHLRRYVQQLLPLSTRRSHR
jgi:TetR/AcrR family transcriptional repressor of nem operon